MDDVDRAHSALFFWSIFGPGIRVVFFDPSKHQARQSKHLKPAALRVL